MTQLRVQDLHPVEQDLSDTGRSLLKHRANSVIVDTDLCTLRADLEEIERRLIPLLITVQRALGKEPSVLTRAERRRG